MSSLVRNFYTKSHPLAINVHCSKTGLSDIELVDLWDEK